jgi:hypothetical protein
MGKYENMKHICTRLTILQPLFLCAFGADSAVEKATEKQTKKAALIFMMASTVVEIPQP